MGDGFDQEKAGILREGFAEAARQDGATTGQVPALAADGQMKFGDAGGGSQPLMMGDPVSLSAAQLRALSGAPVEFVAAPGAGKALWLSSWFLEYVAGGVPFSTPATLEVRWGDAPGFLVREEINAFSASGASVDSPAQAPTLLASVENQPIVLATGSSFAAGPVLATTLAAGGAGYAPGDTGTINGDQQNAAYVIDTVSGGGGVLTYHLTDGGTRYEVGNGVGTFADSGGGSGFTVNITSVNYGNGSITARPLYAVVDLT